MTEPPRSLKSKAVSVKLLPFHFPLPFLLLVIGTKIFSIFFLISSFHGFLSPSTQTPLSFKITSQATFPWVPQETQFFLLYSEPAGSQHALLDFSLFLLYSRIHRCATKLILPVLSLRFKQRKTTLANLSRKGIY